MDFREKSELQLLRVSRGAHELTKMIDSWSKTPCIDGQSKIIANDLRRDAEELHESLLMLSRLQEASKRMSTMKTQQRGGDAEEPRLSVDMGGMRQVVRDRLHRNGLTSKPLMPSGSRVNFSVQVNLVAKLMGLEDFPPGDSDQLKLEKEEEKAQEARSMQKGKEKKQAVKDKNLEEIIETMRSIGVLKSEQSLSLRSKLGVSKNCEALPIVIMRSRHFPNSEREEINPTSQGVAEEKVKLVGLNLEEKMEQGAVRSIGKDKIEPTQKLKSAAAAASSSSQRPLKRAVGFKESRSAEDLKKPGDQGEMHVERKGVKTIGAPIDMNITAPTRPEKKQATAGTSQKNKSIVSNSKKNCTSFNSISSMKKAKISVENPARKSAKLVDYQKSKEKKLNIPLPVSHAIPRSNSISATDGLPKQAQEEPTKSYKRDGIKKYRKVICEVMPRSYQFRRKIGEIEESIKKSHHKSSPKIVPEVKHVLLNSPSFCNQVNELFSTNLLPPAFHQPRYSEEHEIGTDQLLLDCAKELMTRKVREGHRSMNTSFNHLLEEISNGIKKLASYSEDDYAATSQDCPESILEMDLHCHETMLNAVWDDGWDHWICTQEADQAAIKAAEHIIAGLILEVAKDLISYSKITKTIL